MTPREDAPQNPLTDVSGAPLYDRILAAHGEPAVRALVAEAEATLERVLASGAPVTWDGFFVPLDDAEERLDRAWSVLSNLESTIGTPELRDAHRAAQALVTGHRSQIGQDERLYRAVRELAEGPGAASLTPVQRKVLADALRDFRLAGVHLPPAQKQRAREIEAELASLGSTYAENVTDDARAFRLVLAQEGRLAGLPAPLVAA